MVAAVAFFALVMGSPRFQARQSRADFSHAMAKVTEDMTPEQVEELLGPPDDTWPINDAAIYQPYGDLTWCYGTKGHHTMPTLGSVTFREGKVWGWTGAEDPPSRVPPPSSVIGEEELADAMRLMYRAPGLRHGDHKGDMRQRIQVANMLISKGRSKALAILSEYVRLDDGDPTWLFWVVRAAFTSTAPGGAFPVPGIGGFGIEHPGNPAQWPTYPLYDVDGVPYLLFGGARMFDGREPFEFYMRDNQRDWAIRTTPLTPPNDPFPSYEKLVDSFHRLFLNARELDKDRRIGEDAGMRDLLDLVKNAYRPADDACDPKDLDRYHREFLAVGGHWDGDRQTYVRGDGSVLADDVDESPQLCYAFPDTPHLHIKVVLGRWTSKLVGYCATTREDGSEAIKASILSIEDAANGKELSWFSPNQPPYPFPTQPTKDQVLSAPGHSPMAWDDEKSSGFYIPKGRRVRLVLLFDGRRYESPVLTP